MLLAALDVHEGNVTGWVADSTKSVNFVDFLGDLFTQTPEGLDRRAGRPHHRLHQGLQPQGGTVPVDLRRPPTTGRVIHSDFRARALELIFRRANGDWPLGTIAS